MIKHPTVNINVIDRSRTTFTRSNVLPFHTPLFPIQAAKGPDGLKWIDNYNYAVSLYGADTFDPNSKWYTRESLYMQTALQSGNACYAIRLIDNNAAPASLVLEAQLQHLNVPQYQRDSDGNFILDEYDAPIPVLDINNNPVVRPGIKIKYAVRPLINDEKINTVQIKTTSIGGIETTIYPILAFQAFTNGSYGNALGFKLTRDWSIDSTISVRNKTVLYSLAITEQPYDSDIANIIKTIWNENWAVFTFKPKTIDSKTMQNFSFDYVLEAMYYDNTSQTSPISYNVYNYTNHVQTIGETVQVVENNSEITDPYMVDIFSAKDYLNHPYDCFYIDDDSVKFSDNYIMYLQGGTDGDISRNKFEEMYRSYLTLVPNKDLANPFRYPFNTLYDTGYSIKTKNALIGFLGIRDDVVIRLSTQDMSLEPNTKNADYSTGSYLASSLLLQPESIISGTGVCRGELYAHVSKLNNQTIFADWLSPTLEVLQQICRHQSSFILDGAAQASPAANLTLLNPEKFPWYLDDAIQNELFWNAGLNYVQWCSQVDIFFPSRRTVHQWDNSLLSDSTFVDVLIQAKRLVRSIWTQFTGISTIAAASLFGRIKDAIERGFYARVPNGYTLVADIYQTDAEREEGTITHATLYLYGQLPQRTWNVDFIIERSA
jgi:hypothetical protein